MRSNAMLMPAVWGGVFLGVLSALPFVSLGNLCCCLWVILGGVVAAYVLQSNTPEPITLGDGVLVGLLSGIFGAAVYPIVGLPVSLLFGPMQQRLVQLLLESNRDVPDNVRQMLQDMGGSTMTIVGLLIGFVVMLVLGSVFASLGGLLGAVFFRKKTIAGEVGKP